MVIIVPYVTLQRETEKFDSLFRRFKKSVERANTLQDYQKHEFYEKPSEKRKRVRAAARKRAQRLSLEARTPAVWVEAEE